MGVCILLVCICVYREQSLRQACLSVIENHCHILQKLFRETIKIYLAVCMHERTHSYQAVILLLWLSLHSERLHRSVSTFRLHRQAYDFKAFGLSPILKWITLVMMTMIKATSHYCNASAQNTWLHLKWYSVLLKKKRVKTFHLYVHFCVHLVSLCFHNMM